MESQSNSRSLSKQFQRDYFIISLILILFFFTLIVGGATVTQDHLANLITQSTRDLNKDAEKNLQKLGENIIQTKAQDVARQIEVYFRMNPDLTTRQILEDPFFKSIALQKVGNTGYTAMYEAPSCIFRVHPNPKTINKDMSYLKNTLPSWWKIVGATLKGDEASGYYDWIDSDGKTRKKYMTVTPVGAQLKGQTMMVAATTYIDEFSTPVKMMETKAENIVYAYRHYVAQQGLLFGILSAIISLIAFYGVYWLGSRASFRYIMPIMQLAGITGNLGEGKWEISGHEHILKRKDEIGTLAKALDRMSNQLKLLFSNIEKRVCELNEVQKALKESEEHYRSLFEDVPVGLYQTSPDGSVLAANNMIVEMLGFPNRETFLNRSTKKLYVNPNDRESWQKRLEQNNEVLSSETQLRKYNNDIIWVENNSHIVKDAKGKTLYYEGSLIDITKRKKAETALKDSEERFRDLYEESKRAEELYRSLIHSSADAIAIYDLESKIKYISPMFTTIFGWTSEELVGQHIHFTPESELQETKAIARDVIQKGIPCQGFETKRITKDDSLIDVNLSASRYDDHEGNPAGVLVIFRDISEKKRLEVQLQHIERMEAIGTLAGGIAHDFNNLLMAIQGNITKIRHDNEVSHLNHKDLTNIEKQVDRGASLTRQLLGYARKGQYEIKPINLNHIIKENAQAFWRTRKNITIHYDLLKNLFPIEADISQIEQVLMNLFINASDVMPEAGNLFITTRNVTPEDMQDRAYTPKSCNYILLEVKDTGSGMDQKTMEKIFDPFFTTKAMGRGTGLGLASVYGIIKAHDGYIDVESQKDIGTIFHIYLPASQKEIDSTADKAQTIFHGTGTILLVDDEEMILEAGADMLDLLGYTVLTAENGQKAVEKYQKDKDRIDLVILDMIMPDMSGGMVFDKLRTINPNVCVILSSGYSVDGKATDIMNRGCNGFIQKPYTIEAISKKLNSVIKKR